MIYYPEEWMLVRIMGTDPHYRVFGSWRGGYLNGDSWRLNSGIVSAKLNEENSDYIDFYGHTGSVYSCNVNTQGIRSPHNRGVLNDICEKSAGTAFVIEYMETQDILANVWTNA